MIPQNDLLISLHLVAKMAIGYKHGQKSGLVGVGDERHTLKSGDTIFLPRNISHPHLVLSETAKMRFMTTPGGITETFFSRMSQGFIAPADFPAIFKAHDQGLVGPPLKAT